MLGGGALEGHGSGAESGGGGPRYWRCSGGAWQRRGWRRTVVPLDEHAAAMHHEPLHLSLKAGGTESRSLDAGGTEAPAHHEP